MERLTFNAVVKGDDATLEGFFRVVGIHPSGDSAWLAFIADLDGPCERSSRPPGSISVVATETLTALIEQSRLAVVDLDDPRAVAKEATLKKSARRCWEKRIEVMEPFLNPQALLKSFSEAGGIGPIVRAALSRHKAGRATIYRLWGRLCLGGISALSLMPDFDRCGGPGVARPVEGGRCKAGAKTGHELKGVVDEHPQRGVTTEDRQKIVLHTKRLWKPGARLVSVYDEVIRAVYVTRYRTIGGKLEPVLPPEGSYPNKRQFRYIVETELQALERAMRRTTEGHFTRNRRGLHGSSYDGVIGPGHVYAIDSTIADMHLRSSIDRSWFVGRPIVYIMVDVWSTAVVGFYACLRPPSWQAAKLALFSCFSDPKVVAQLWGHERPQVLEPTPTAPFSLLSDRGEYLSEAARKTLLALGMDAAFNPAYRPDLKGLVEVLNRITKDTQFDDFVPGAIDARRRELELKPDARTSAMTLREYVQYLYCVFDYYNACADRGHRMTAEMIAAGVPSTPAGLWKFGHDIGLGFRRHVPYDQLVTNLLTQTTITARRDGNFVEALQYEGELAEREQWSAHARNFGSVDRTAFIYPGHAGKVWVPGNSGLCEFNLKYNARVDGKRSVNPVLEFAVAA